MTRSRHARRRAAQRAVSDAHVDLALDWGHSILQRNGRVAYHLGHNEASAAREAGVEVPCRAIGTTVVMAPDGVAVTLIRSDDRRRLRRNGKNPRRRRS